MKSVFTATLAAAIITGAAAFADGHANNPKVGGAEMFPSKNIVENAVNSPIHTTLVAAVTAAGLVDTLSSEGPFTVFAPTDEAFGALPAGTVETLVKPENKETLTKILTAHVVAGNIMAADLVKAIKASPNGFYHFQTVSGDTLSAQLTPHGSVFIFDESSNAYKVSAADVKQSNCVIDVIDGVLIPK